MKLFDAFHLIKNWLKHQLGIDYFNGSLISSSDLEKASPKRREK